MIDRDSGTTPRRLRRGGDASALTGIVPVGRRLDFVILLSGLLVSVITLWGYGTLVPIEGRVGISPWRPA